MSLLPVLLCAVTMMLAFNISPAELASTFNKSDDQLSLSANYPTIKIFCYVDYFSNKQSVDVHQPDFDDIKSYIASFWKTVDHYFRLLGIRIELTGIKIKTSEFLSDRGVIYFTNVSNLNLHKERKDDIVVVISWFPICVEPVMSGIECESFVPFTMPEKNACAVDKPVIVIRDRGAYQGIRGAVISIGSLLGAVPDGSPGAENCPASDGYFMSPYVHFGFPYQFSWSNCSTKMIQNFVESSEASCLRSNFMSDSRNFSNDNFPGERISLDDFCNGLKRKIVKDDFKTTNWNSGNVCSELICEYESGLKIKGPALEGSWCAEGKRCRYGNCSSFPFNEK